MRLKSNEKKYVSAITSDLERHVKHSKPTIEKLAASFGIANKNLIKELTELAIVNIARKLAHEPVSIEERYYSIVELYKHQVNLSHRTSESIRLQQYSTPAPISYLAGVFCDVDNNNGLYFEPSAGNGLMTIAGKPSRFIVNEVDDVRRCNLKTQGFKEVLNQDASKSFERFKNRFDAVLTNPPFGSLPEPELIGNYWTKILDHKMAVVALETMKNTGKAAIIIGGHTQWDAKGRIQKGKNRDFFLYLYRHYEVLDVINIDGHKLYSRQGTAFNVRLILIDGRKTKPGGFPPIEKNAPEPVDTFQELYNRVMRWTDSDNKPVYRFKVGDKVSFIGVGYKPKTAKVDSLSNQYWYWIKIGKQLSKVHEDNLVPAIEYARKSKSSQGYSAFRNLNLTTRQEYEVKFIDSSFPITIFSEDREEAIINAIKHRIEIRKQEKKLNNQNMDYFPEPKAISGEEKQKRLRLAKVKAAAKLKLLKLLEV